MGYKKNRGKIKSYKVKTVQDSRGYFAKITIFNYTNDSSYYMTDNKKIYRVYPTSHKNIYNVKNREVHIENHSRFQKN